MASGRFHYGITPLPYNRPVRRSNSDDIEATPLITLSPLTPPTTSISTQTRSIQSPLIQRPSVQTTAAATTSITENDTKSDCPICLEPETTTTTATTQSVLTKPCNHAFHLACIKTWIIAAPPHPQDHQYVSCPMCRGPVKSVWDGQGQNEVLSGSRYPRPGGMGRIGDFGGRIPLIGGGSIDPFVFGRDNEGTEDIGRHRHQEQEHEQEQRRRGRMSRVETESRLAALREAERFRALTARMMEGREYLLSGLSTYPDRLASGPGNPPNHDNYGSLTETEGQNTPYSSPSYPRSSRGPGYLPNHYNYGSLGDPANPPPYGYLRHRVNQPLPNFHGRWMQPEDLSILPARPIIDPAARRPIHEDEPIRIPSIRTENLERRADMGLEVPMMEQRMRLSEAQLRLHSQAQTQGQGQAGRSIGAEINGMGGIGGSERSLDSGSNAGSRIGNRNGRNVGGDIIGSTANETNSSPWGYTSRRKPRSAPKCFCPQHRYDPTLEE